MSFTYKFLSFPQQVLLPHLTAAHVGTVLSPLFLRTLVNHFNSRESYLHAHSKKCVERLCQAVDRSSSGEFKLAVALALMRTGKTGFDQVRASGKAGCTRGLCFRAPVLVTQGYNRAGLD